MENIVTLGLLILLQLVLGFDNLLYISLESQRAPEKDRARVRKLGIGLAVGLRIALLFVLTRLVATFQEPLFGVDTSMFEGHFNFHSLIVLLGGAFILYTATKEIFHMLSLEDIHAADDAAPTSARKVITMIVIMNLVFSFDSILSAMALTEVMWVMSSAIVIGGVLMIYLSEHVSTFLQKNRMYEVLGLFVLFLVGVMLLSEGGHLAHLSFFGNEVTPMSKTTFYFVIGVLLCVDIVQSRYQRKLNGMKAKRKIHVA